MADTTRLSEDEENDETDQLMIGKVGVGNTTGVEL